MADAATIAVATGNDSERLDAILRRTTTVLSGSTFDQWHIRLPGTRRRARLRLSAEWLNMSLPLRALDRSPDPELIGGMLDHNARLEGSARIIGSGLRRQRQLVVDVPADLLPWDSESELETLIAALLESIGTAVNVIGQPRAIRPQTPLPHEQLQEALDEAGWPAQAGEAENLEGPLEVPLEVPGTYLAARVRHDSRSTRLTVPILVDELAAAPQECRNAVIVLLWLMASHVRMVRAVRARRALALEVSLLPGHASAAALAHGCAALSAALQQVATEAELLASDDHLAQIYLSNLGLSTAA